LGLPSSYLGYDPTDGTLIIDKSLRGTAPFVKIVRVDIDGTPTQMYALPLHQSFPPGACLETMFEHSPFDTGCVPPALGLALLLWQSHSAGSPPDRLVVLLGDVGGTH